MVLGHIILQAKHAGGVHLFVRIGLGCDRSSFLAFGSGVEVEEAQILHEHRRTFQQRAIGIDHEAATVKHQIVLASHLVEIDHRRVHFGRTAYRKVDAGVGFAFLIWRTVHGEQQIDVLLGELRHGTAILPDVFANGHADACTVHVEHHGFVAGTENAEFVEHTIVGQKVLVVAGPNHAVMQYDESVARLGCLAISADRADHHKQVAKPIGSQFGGKPAGFVPRGFTESGPQCEVFNRISGKRHFRKDHDLCAVAGSEMRIAHDFVCVGVEISHASVDLGEGETNVCHG